MIFLLDYADFLEEKEPSEYQQKIDNRDPIYFNNQDEQDMFECSDCSKYLPISERDDYYAGTCIKCAARLED